MKTKSVKERIKEQLSSALIILFLFQTTSMANAASVDELNHQHALTQAQRGDYPQALHSLKLLATQYPRPNRYFYDYISILSWAGQHQKIVALSADLPLQQAPSYVLRAVAIAYRHQRDYPKAEQVYRVADSRFPDLLDAKIGLGLVLIDQKKYASARTALFPLHIAKPENIELLRAIAYFHEAQQQLITALEIYQRILDLKPSDRASQRNKVLTLNKMGASQLANSFIKDPGLFSNGELARIRSNMAAQRIRWAAIPPEQEKMRFNEVEQAIAELEKNIEEARLTKGDSSTYALIGQFDLLVALRDRYRMEEAVKLYNKLHALNIVVPAYAQRAACDALLYLERPEQAEACYLQVKRAVGEDNPNLDLALFYAYLENEKATLAQQWVKEVAAKQVPYIVGKGQKPLHKPNPKKTQAETIAALSVAYADKLEDAEKQILALHQLAPYNTDLRRELANIDYWRGWPRKAEEEYAIGLNQEPKHIGLRLGLARNQLELKQYEQAEQSINLLFQQYPEDKGIALQHRLWNIHNMREFKTEISTSESSGGVHGSRGLDINSYLYSRPLDKNYRLYIHQRHSQAKFSEGDGLLNHAGIGIEYSAENILLMSELHHNYYEDERLGINFKGEYSFDDHWSTSLSLESLSGDTPLRALNQGIYAKSASWGGQYRWHESRATGLNLSYLDFSDGNERKSISGFWQESWYNSYDYKFSTRLDLYSSDNSKANTIYFNPDRDLAGSIALENEWLSWRHYENSFHQRLIVSAGFYNQENHSTGDTWGLQYEHRWATDHRLEVIYGIKRARYLYDGDYELSWSYYLSLDWRF
ncbi:MAG: poly-beta-1,6 N-acetyl-D-glucosamine export porin PgaA [Candidatus Reddybacter sp.]